MHCLWRLTQFHAWNSSQQFWFCIRALFFPQHIEKALLRHNMIIYQIHTTYLFDYCIHSSILYVNKFIASNWIKKGNATDWTQKPIVITVNTPLCTVPYKMIDWQYRSYYFILHKTTHIILHHIKYYYKI